MPKLPVFLDHHDHKIPESKEEWEDVKTRFLNTFKLKDDPSTWTFILSQLQNVKMPELSFSPNSVFDHYKRFLIAKVLQDEKTVYIEELKRKLESAFNELKEANGTSSPDTDSVPERSFHSEGDVPSLPHDPKDLVSKS